ncbi:uncharacterized protein LOC116299663 [Actinia tenebrosa]|uniref:Uncharacterized protein LOC116299663 n=1 Tax=Actinia tenebrosa TaxID=6105 RepID=A0A6P8IDF9_ACTTE|nr:uncharacterized protein LOC116299663 [Actinia tenebrosa]
MSNLGCYGEFINELRFIVLQHMIIDNKLGVCTHPDLSRLEQVFHDKEEYLTKIAHWKDLEADDFAPCAAKMNRRCATELAKEFMSNKKLCSDVSHFMDCYKSAPCDDKIYKDFVQDLKMCKEIFIQKYAKDLRELSCQ